jgi:hypothetical protein
MVQAPDQTMDVPSRCKLMIPAAKGLTNFDSWRLSVTAAKSVIPLKNPRLGGWQLNVRPSDG